MRLSAGFSDGSIVSTPFSMVQLAQCPQNGGFVDILEHHFSKFKKNHSGYEVA
jgi:hypothetical protein